MTRHPPARTLWCLPAPSTLSGDSTQSVAADALALGGPSGGAGGGAGGAVRLTPEGSPEPAPDTQPPTQPTATQPSGGALVLLAAAHPPAGSGSATGATEAVAGVLLVAGLGGRGHSALTLDGVAVADGLHVLRHGACVLYGESRYWLSSERAAEESTYDPAVDGGDVFCARTKLRLEPGDAIVRCPGTPSRSCDLLFRASTWDAALRCHQCGHDPSAPRWSPPLPRPIPVPASDSAGGTASGTSRLDRLLKHARIA